MDITLTLTVYMGKSTMKGAMDITLTLTVYMGKECSLNLPSSFISYKELILKYFCNFDLFRSLSSCQLGRPGVPGSNDLETALRRLSMKQKSASEHSLKEEDELDHQRY